MLVPDVSSASFVSPSENNMTAPHQPRLKYVIGPDGGPLTLADLPEPGTARWVVRRKAQVVAAVRGGLLSLDDACSRYMLTVEEFLAWQRRSIATASPGCGQLAYNDIANSRSERRVQASSPFSMSPALDQKAGQIGQKYCQYRRTRVA
jgi:hypothetical protein